MKNLIDVHQLKFSWNKKAPWLLDIDSFSVAAGEKVFLYGPSGGGKSTFLNILGGVVQPHSGHVKILDQSLDQMSMGQKDKFRGDHFGFVFQMFNLLPYYTSLENILLPLRFSAHKSAKIGGEGTAMAEVKRIIAALRLPESILEKRVTQLSVGQQQRVAVARALIGKPDIIIADEPTSSLDALSQQAFVDLLFSECDRHKIGLVFVSHDMSLGKDGFDRVVSLSEINQGTVIDLGIS